MRAHARPHTVGFQPFPSTCDSNRLVSKKSYTHSRDLCLAHSAWRAQIGRAACRVKVFEPTEIHPRCRTENTTVQPTSLSCPSGSTCDGSAKHRVDGLEKTTASGEDLSPLGQARKSLPPALLHPVPWLQRWVGKARTRAGALAHGQSNINAHAPKKQYARSLGCTLEATFFRPGNMQTKAFTPTPASRRKPVHFLCL